MKINPNSGFNPQENTYMKELVLEQAKRTDEIENELPYKQGHWFEYAKGTSTDNTITIDFDKPVSSAVVFLDDAVCTSFTFNEDVNIVLSTPVSVAGNFGVLAFYRDTTNHLNSGIAHLLVDTIKSLTLTLSGNTDYTVKIID